MNRTYLMALLAATSLAPEAAAQLRVVTYNTLDKPFNATDEAEVRTIFEAIAATDRNGIAKRPDIIALQEQRTFSLTDSTAARIAEELNDLFGVASYTSRVNGFGTDRLAYVYDEATVSLDAVSSVFTAGPRPTYRGMFQPVGYTSPEATIYAYNSHLKAGSTGSDVSTRTSESSSIRANADALGADVNAIFLGDFNYGSSFEAGTSISHGPAPPRRSTRSTLPRGPVLSIRST